ncbi:MAG: hypothetical protein HYY81_07555 [Deltaproteobacteria bacterium]|nr:hypothetical protein [Deltaproteobacteria bacterium]
MAVMDSGEEAVVRKLGFKILADLTDVPFLGSVHVTTETFMRKNADVVKKYMRGIVKTLKFIWAKPEQTKVVLKKLYRETDDVVAAERYKALVKFFPAVPYVTEDAVSVILDILREKGELKKRVEPSEFLNVGFLREAAEVEKTK